MQNDERILTFIFAYEAKQLQKSEISDFPVDNKEGDYEITLFTFNKTSQTRQQTNTFKTQVFLKATYK